MNSYGYERMFAGRGCIAKILQNLFMVSCGALMNVF